MHSITVKQAKDFDIKAQTRYGIPNIVLMENAGRGASRVALKMLGGKKKACVFCGKGNNGGDGFVTARHLINKNKTVKVFLVGGKKDLKYAALINFNVLARMGIKVFEIKSASSVKKIIKQCKDADLIIDALLGIGAKGEVKEPLKSVIELINNLNKKVLAIDVPSGLDADTGKILGSAVKADKTVTFVAAKKGFYKNLGQRYAGKIIIKDIGIK